MNRWTGTKATKARAALARVVATGTAVCWRCGAGIDPRDPWDVGHIVGRAAGGQDTARNYAPEHSSCNRRAGQAVGQARGRARRAAARRVRAW